MIFLKTCGLLALVPQASKKPLGQKTTSAAVDWMPDSTPKSSQNLNPVTVEHKVPCIMGFARGPREVRSPELLHC